MTNQKARGERVPRVLYKCYVIQDNELLRIDLNPDGAAHVFRANYWPPLAAFLTLLLVFQPGGDLWAQVAVPTPQELDQLLAPIALYPDALLAQITAASTNPQEILDVDHWLQQNGGLSGDALTKAAEQQGFDPEFLALVNFPQVLNMMAQNIDDYAAIGAAFSANQATVSDSVQRLRAEAYASGALRSTPQLQVVQQSPQVIVIQPANPQVVYVPQYDPAVIYAGPPVGSGVGGLITFGAGIAIGTWIAQPWGWGGWGWNWGGRRMLYRRGVWYRGNNRYRPPRPTYRPRPVPYAGRPGYGGNWSRPGNRPSSNRPGNGNRPSPGRPPTTRPATKPAPGPRPTTRPAPGPRPTTRPAPAAGPAPNRNPYAGFPQNKQAPAQGSRPTGSRPSAFGGGNSGAQTRAASARGQREMQSSGGGQRKR